MVTQVCFGKLKSLVKWAGGKGKELKYILPNLPRGFENYYEPFVGGGAVYTAVDARKYFINDKSVELIAFYRCIIDSDRGLFFNVLDEMACSWGMLADFVRGNADFFLNTYRAFAKSENVDGDLKLIIDRFVLECSGQLCDIFPAALRFDMANFLVEIKVNLVRKMSRMRVIEAKEGVLSDMHVLGNMETGLKSAFYMHIRYLYNNKDRLQLLTASQAAIFFFIRNFTYSSMFRYNASGEFNVPYGGMAYNKKNFLKKVGYLKIGALESRLSRTVIENLDFEEFLQRHEPSKNDFLFLDPPYDSEFSTYDKNEFTKDDQVRLASYLLDKCEAKWMMIIKNTDFIYKLYAGRGLNIKSFGKQYLVSFMNRNDKQAEHLLITNY